NLAAVVHSSTYTAGYIHSLSIGFECLFIIDRHALAIIRQVNTKAGHQLKVRLISRQSQHKVIGNSLNAIRSIQHSCLWRKLYYFRIEITPDLTFLYAVLEIRLHPVLHGLFDIIGTDGYGNMGMRSVRFERGVNC